VLLLLAGGTPGAQTTMGTSHTHLPLLLSLPGVRGRLLLLLLLLLLVVVVLTFPRFLPPRLELLQRPLLDVALHGKVPLPQQLIHRPEAVQGHHCMKVIREQRPEGVLHHTQPLGRLPRLLLSSVVQDTV
jgi:hypothetical protein